MADTKEPEGGEWRIVTGTKYPVTMLFQGERQVCELSGIGDPDDLDRITACLNACEGIQIEDLRTTVGGDCESLAQINAEGRRNKELARFGRELTDGERAVVWRTEQNGGEVIGGDNKPRIVLLPRGVTLAEAQSVIDSREHT